MKQNMVIKPAQKADPYSDVNLTISTVSDNDILAEYVRRFTIPHDEYFSFADHRLL